jgi:hypothetical protein
MNKICEEQNSEHQLERLAAQRQLYSEAKRIQNISAILTIPLALMWVALAALFPALQEYAALWGVVVTFVDFPILNRLQKSMQEKAAKIQQLFDCDVFQMNWISLNCETRPEPELVRNYSARFRQNNLDYSELHNWYPVSVCQLPLEQARFICQRTNIWWDAKLRRRYANWLLSALVAILVTIALVGLFLNLTLENLLLAFLVPLMPTFSFGLRQYFEQIEAANRLDRLRENSEAILQSIVGGKINSQDLERESYNLQSQIYDNRRRSPLIFDWLYFLLKRQDEEQMNVGAEALIAELNQAS